MLLHELPLLKLTEEHKKLLLFTRSENGKLSGAGGKPTMQELVKLEKWDPGSRHDSCWSVALNLHTTNLSDELKKKYYISTVKAHTDPEFLAEREEEVYRIFEDAGNSDVAIKTKEETKERSLIQVLTAKQLIEHVPPKELWGIPHYLPLYASTILSAESKTGKSMLAMYMAHCLSSGKDFLGKYPVIKGNVFYVDKELGINEFQRRAIKLGITEGSSLFTSHNKSFLLDKRTFLPFREVLRDLDIKYLFLDSMRRVHIGKENDSDVIMLLFHMIDQYIEDGISVFIPHHNNKKKPKEGKFQPDFTEDEQPRGSTDIEGACGQLMLLTPKKDNLDTLRVRWKRPRYEKQPPDEFIKLKEENSLLFFELDEEIKHSLVKTKKDRFRVDVLKLIPKGGDIARQDLLDFCKKEYQVSEDTFDRRMKELLDEWAIDKVGDENDGRGVRYMLLEK